jgi:hypothetical protein|tara:strand:- start:202 stop:354 length:153 start_codon:yes stop_codon:yes gene_type:complete
MGKNITTPDNIKFGDLSAEARMKILKMREEKEKKEEERKLRLLYNKSKMD